MYVPTSPSVGLQPLPSPQASESSAKFHKKTLFYILIPTLIIPVIAIGVFFYECASKLKRRHEMRKSARRIGLLESEIEQGIEIDSGNIYQRYGPIRVVSVWPLFEGQPSIFPPALAYFKNQEDAETLVSVNSSLSLSGSPASDLESAMTKVETTYVSRVR